MPQRKNRNLTEGNIIKNLLVVSVPTMFGFFAQTLYDFIDMIWIGRISAQAVAGVVIFVTIFWLADIVNEIIGISAVSLISQSYGAGRLEKTREIIEQSIFFKLCSSAPSIRILSPFHFLDCFFVKIWRFTDRYSPVNTFDFINFSGVPAKIISPPSGPAPGPRSII